MMKNLSVCLFATGLGFLAFAAQDPDGWNGPRREPMTFTADRIVGNGQSKALWATGHVHAVSQPLNLQSECLTRFEDGRILLSDPTHVTTCTNAPGLIHWRATGEVEYRADDYVILRNMWVRLFEIPVFWLPYLYYPLDTDCGFSWMPGYTGRWGAFLLTKYRYHLLGDPYCRDYTWWLKGATRFDLRYRQGVALGEDLKWNLGDFGEGQFSVYYAWDQEAEDRYNAGFAGSNWDYSGWGSSVDQNRYCISLGHQYEATERDNLWLQASVYSDTYVRNDFFRRTMLNFRNDWQSYEASGLFWDHVESGYAFGGEASGRLNEFYEAVGRLPEFYFDVHPLKLFGSAVNYETENRIGYLTRNPAEYGSTLGGIRRAYAYNPGPWAEYEAFRGDTYHRLTCPFRTLDDLVSVVPRLAFRGTFWNETGETDLSGRNESRNAGAAFRSILEGGTTFAGRGVAWVNDNWQHMTEPYLDILAQKAWHNGVDSSNRPYVFDNLDASLTWEDQFAGRGRNLPYSYYGVTPGWRNAWSRLDEFGRLNQVLDFDLYSVLDFGRTEFYGDDDAHKLARVGFPNYGDSSCHVTPGTRLRWMPDGDTMLGARAEYDTDRSRVALVDVTWRQRLSADFDYFVNYGIRDFRYWDFSSMPYYPEEMREDVFNMIKCHYAVVGFTQKPIDWFQWSPFVRWDMRDNELDSIGGWFDFLTDCLGFRIQVDYMNEYTFSTGYVRQEDYSIGFYIYLRAFGADANSLFVN